MATDVVTIKNESLRIDEDHDSMEISSNAEEEKLHNQQPRDACLDFQKKVTLSKHEKEDNDVTSFFGNKETYEQLIGMYGFMKLTSRMERKPTIEPLYVVISTRPF